MSTNNPVPAEPSIDDYTIGWICALQEEFEAACRMLDYEFLGPLTAAMNDDNTYTFGFINEHNIVIGCLAAGQYGESSAANVAKDMVRTFTNLRFALMVGIGGGAPTEENDIRLGDVVVSQPTGQHGGVLQYDFVKRHKLPNGEPDYERVGQLSAPPNVLLGALPIIKRHHNDPRKPDKIASHLERMKDMPEYYQRPAEDRLYCSDYGHLGGRDCSKCQENQIKPRPDRQLRRAVCVHYGTIGTANSLMKNVDERDKYARDLGILCFEMEAGGLMNTWPCLVIRGICDYSDSHKNDAWHKYAALVAAAYARELICVLKPVGVTKVPPWSADIKEAIIEVKNQISIDSQKTNTIFQHIVEKEKDLPTSLTSIDHTLEYNRYIATRQEGTGKWFLNCDQYLAWLSSNNRTLFCPGIPGAGNDDSEIGIAYLFCNTRRKDENTIENLLGSLLQQLIRYRPSLLCQLQGIFKDKHKDKARPTLQQIFDALHIAAQSFSKTLFIVDALDECTTSDGCRAKLLWILHDLRSISTFHTFVTSRALPDIIHSFSTAETVEIRADIGDVRRFLESRIQEFPSWAHKSKEIQEEITMVISEATDGMFLLARLYLNLLSHKLTHNEIRKELALLKKKCKEFKDDEKRLLLAQAYEKTMDSIKDRGQAEESLALEALSWVTFVARDLTILELQHAISVKFGEAYVDEGDLRFAEDIVYVCSGLITVNPATGTVQLTHYTTQEYFERTHHEWFPDVQIMIFKKCIGYISSDHFKDGCCDTVDGFRARRLSYPLYMYASEFWGVHARSVASEAQALILAFLKNECTRTASAQAFQISRLNSYATNTKTVPDEAILALESISARYRDAGHIIEPRETTALHVAAMFGLESAVVALLMEGHPLDPKDFAGRTPLSLATEFGHEGVAKILLEGSPVNRKRLYSRRRAKLPLENREADVNATDLMNRTPLFYATSGNHEAVLRVLLAHHQIDANISDKEGKTALFHAAVEGKVESLTQLLGLKGIDPNVTEKFGRTALHAAASKSRVAIVRLLLDCTGIDPNITHLAGFTPLAETIYATRAPLFKIDSVGHDIESNVFVADRASISAVLSRQYEEVMGRLLKLKDTNIDRINGLSATASDIQEEIKQLLSKPGEGRPKPTDVLVTLGGSPSTTTIRHSHEIFQLLAESKHTNLNVRDLLGHTPLIAAIHCEDESLVKILLACKSIDPNFPEGDGCTPLHEAILEGSLSMMVFLH
ncbi:ankyrin repeat protein [Fusarium flagelliforme]|uniref:Ankyrin repeat protein n=1 Tax=Fusarium flagelliforme TaxID=2675880 RepID=A0A395MP27_9HYPO|nr:ankyrin repeat protein [Fusarium flagelliforme]